MSIAVAVLADDPITEEGAIVRLNSYDEISARSLDSCHADSAFDVLLVLANGVTGSMLTRVARVRRESGGGGRGVPVVLVANEFPEHSMLRAISLGLVNLLYRKESSFNAIARAVVSAARGCTKPGGDGVQQRLIGQIKAIRETALIPHGLNVAGLGAREVNVLRLLADGLSTKEVAGRIGCSERTIKSVIHQLVARHNLKNRTHAVAFALRTGVL
ncbi:helix-turn-helix transcriptional regulator [Streptomyces varsoviensis]|uniref:LuxR family transcriptional regulator n=1 Tax=Streptomyces varsoviensis TaxID=67373 RepID=A0ABR5J1W5_9ACTN|nr:LuxR C-terminal-related transcriptional regulator [Streptomyces varsoviensis]KOG87413.1 LuxR family transcriptional regulator [Streptomyces varsoviensis]